MRSLLLAACAWLTCTLAAGCSNDHTGIPATAPFDPIGSEPTSGDGGAGAIGQLCAEACANIVATCPGQFENGYCVPQCMNNANNYPGCEAQAWVYTACLATTKLDCVYGIYRAPSCDPALQAIGDCLNQPPPTPR